MHLRVRLMRLAARVSRATIISSVGCSTAFAVACSDDAEAPLNTGGNAGSSAAGTGGGGSGMGGASAAGAAGAPSAMGGSGGISAVPFAPIVLFSFDPTTVGTYGWVADPSTGSVSLVNEDRDPANTTPGALRFTAVFPNYDTLGASLPVSVIHEFGNPTTGTSTALQGGTRVHFWIRLVSPTGLPTSLDFFQPFIQGGAATGYSNNFGFSTPDTLADNLWHEFVLEVAGQTFMNDVWRVGVQLAPEAGPVPIAAGPDAGGTDPDAGRSDGGASSSSLAPAPITLDIDYVWVE